VTILGDDLYCKQALCEAFIREGLNFILVCKPDPHKTLTEWVAGPAATGDVQTLEVKRRQGKYRYSDTYRFANQVPVRWRGGPRSRIDRPAVDAKKWAPIGRPITRRSREEKTWQLAFSDLN
jgi:hypothetical protein